MYEPFVYAILFFGGVAVWLPIYYYMVSKWVAPLNVGSFEKEDLSMVISGNLSFPTLSRISLFFI